VLFFSKTKTTPSPTFLVQHRCSPLLFRSKNRVSWPSDTGTQSHNPPARPPSRVICHRTEAAHSRSRSTHAFGRGLQTCAQGVVPAAQSQPLAPVCGGHTCFLVGLCNHIPNPKNPLVLWETSYSAYLFIRPNSRHSGSLLVKTVHLVVLEAATARVYHQVVRRLVFRLNKEAC